MRDNGRGLSVTLRRGGHAGDVPLSPPSRHPQRAPPPWGPGAPHAQGEAAGAALTPLTLLEAWRDGGRGAGGGRTPMGAMARGWGQLPGPLAPRGYLPVCTHVLPARLHTCRRAYTCTHVFMHARPCARAHAHPLPLRALLRARLWSCAHRTKPPHPFSPIPGWVWGHDSRLVLPGVRCPQTARGHGAIAGRMAGSPSAWRPAPAPPGRLAVRGWGPHGGDRVAWGSSGGVWWCGSEGARRVRGWGCRGGTPWPGKGWHAVGERPHENKCHAGRRGGASVGENWHSFPKRCARTPGGAPCQRGGPVALHVGTWFPARGE